MAQILLNNVFTKLTAAVAAIDTTINVTAGEGALFALATGGNTIRATLVKMSGYREIAWEIVDITARSTDALTVTRARESTTALAFAIGDVVDVRMTAGLILPPSLITTTAATYSVTVYDESVIANRAGTVTLTLLAAASYPGRKLWVRTIQAQTVVSVSSNVVPLAGGAAGTAILSATAGKWAMLQSDGTNWQIMAAA